MESGPRRNRGKERHPLRSWREEICRVRQPLPGAPQIDPNNEGKLASKVLLLYLKGTDDEGEEKTIGYFYSGGLTSKGLSSVIKEALRLCHEAVVEIMGTTCDGPTVNIAMLNELGRLLFYYIDFL